MLINIEKINQPNKKKYNSDDWDFDCSQCGACCRAIGCPYITAENLCSIYDSRPFVCDTRRMFNMVHSQNMTKQEYFAKAKIACDQLKELQCQK